MKFNNTENERVELEDGREVFLSRSVAVVATIFAYEERPADDTAYFLAVKRGKGVDNSGKWCLPCGYLDWDESAEEAIIREVWEETGINVNDGFLTKEETLRLDVNDPDNIPDGYCFDYYMNKPWLVKTDPKSDPKQNVSLYFGGYWVKDKLPIPHADNAAEGEVDEVAWVPLKMYEELDWAFNHGERIVDYQKFIYSLALTKF